jgi:hypothetical protein
MNPAARGFAGAARTDEAELASEVGKLSP